MILANSLGFHNIEAESDSSDVVQFCNGQNQWWDAAAAIFAECLDLATGIGRVKFKHCGRSANEVAHEIAKQVYVSKVSCNWVDEPPSFFIPNLINDVTFVDG